MKMGKKVEHLSFDNQAECRSWQAALEKVLGLCVEELLSEDEGADPGEGEDIVYYDMILLHTLSYSFHRHNFFLPSFLPRTSTHTHTLTHTHTHMLRGLAQ